MFNISFIYGKVAEEPKARFSEDQPDNDNVMFNLEILLQEESFGWVQVYCGHEQAKYAAKKVHKGSRVVVIGPLIRGSLNTGKEVWWNEVMVVAHILKIIE